MKKRLNQLGLFIRAGPLRLPSAERKEKTKTRGE